MGGSIFIYISRALRSDVQPLKIDDSAIKDEVQLLTSVVKESSRLRPPVTASRRPEMPNVADLQLLLLFCRSQYAVEDARNGSRYALLLNIKLSNSGLNLHHMCSDIIVCVADNINQIMQALSQVRRISQREAQRIWIVTLGHSFDQILQYFRTKKMVRRQAIVYFFYSVLSPF